MALRPYRYTVEEKTLRLSERKKAGHFSCDRERHESGL